MHFQRLFKCYFYEQITNVYCSVVVEPTMIEYMIPQTDNSVVRRSNPTCVTQHGWEN